MILLHMEHAICIIKLLSTKWCGRAQWSKKIQIHLMNNNRTSLKFLVSGLVKMRDIPIFPK